MPTPNDAPGDGAIGGADGQPAAQPVVSATPGKPDKPEVFTKEQIESATSAAVNAALKKHREEQAALIADKTKDAEAKLAEVGKRAEEAERYGVFVDAAIPAGVTDLKAAYVVAKELGYFKAGKLDITEFKKEHPAFFAIKSANVNGGAGTGGATPSGGMNAFIRSARRG